jgi:hypothetical protein
MSNMSFSSKFPTSHPISGDQVNLGTDAANIQEKTQTYFDDAASVNSTQNPSLIVQLDGVILNELERYLNSVTMSLNQKSGTKPKS